MHSFAGAGRYVDDGSLFQNAETCFLGQIFRGSYSSTLHLENDLTLRKLTNIYASVNGSEDGELATLARRGAECGFVREKGNSPTLIS